MADNIPSGLGVVGTYGVAEQDLQKLREAQESGIQALEQRYASPNWFNVAAGFLKPQLGGFAASLGSASQALGETLEKQRESQIPLAKMRAELAMTGIGMGKDKAAADAFAKWKATGKPMDESTYSQIVGLAPNSSVATAAKAAYEGERAGQGVLAQQQQLRSSQYGQALTAAQQKFSSGAISRDEYTQELARAEKAFGPTQAVTPTRPLEAPGTTPQPQAVVPGAPAPAGAGVVAAAPEAMPAVATTVPTFVLGAGAAKDAGGRLEILQQELNKAYPLAAGGDTRAQGDVASLVREAKRLGATLDIGVVAPAPAAKQEKVLITSPFASNEAGLTPEALNAAVAANETSAKAKFDELEKIAGPRNYDPVRTVIKDQMSLIKQNPALAKQVTTMLSRGDFASQVGTALEKGIGLNLGGIAGQIKLPVMDVLSAGWNDKQRELAQTMANNYAKMAVYQQKLGGLNPNAASNMEAGMYKALTPTMETTPLAALRSMGHLLTDLDATHAQYKFVNEVYRGRHPLVSVAKNVPDRYSAIFSHPTFEAVYNPYSKEHQEINAAFQRRLAPQAPVAPKQ